MLTPEQIAERRNYIGASDAGAVLGLSSWKSPLEVWTEKTSKVEHEDIGDKMHIKLGNALEDFVARQFMDETGKKVQRVNKTLYHPKYPFIACNLDRIVLGEKVPLEIKTAGEFMAKEWKGEEAPPQYLCQVLHQMACTGAPYGYLAVLIGNRDFKWLKVERDEALIETIIQREVSFWNDFVVPKVMPHVTKRDNEVLNKLFAEAVEEVVALDDNARKIVESLNGLKADKKHLEGIIDLQENQLKAILGDKLGGTTGDYRVWWKPQSQERFDTTKFKKEHPEMVKDYIKTISFRKLSILTAKEAK